MRTGNESAQTTNVLRSAFTVRFGFVGGLLLLIAGCAAPTGTAHLYQIQPSNSSAVVGQARAVATQSKDEWDKSRAAETALRAQTPAPTPAALKAATDQTREAKERYQDAKANLKKAEAGAVNGDIFSNNKTLAIHKTDSGGVGDVFAVYLTDAYFKYLKDVGGVNEVVIIAEFTEVGSEEKSATMSKVDGPYLGVADNSRPPLLNKLLYGPKKLESDHLSMKLTVLEYDQGENEDSAAFLDFIASASKTLSLANPITAAEQVFAKEVAKSLLALNKDDVVMQIDLDMVANGSDDVLEGNGSILPLNSGNYVLINQEHCAPTNCYYYMSRRGNEYNPLAWLGDTLMLVPTAMRRGWTDTPDKASQDDIEADQIESSHHGLRSNNQSFKDKTWLSFSIVKGGDDALWGRRRALIEAEKAIQYINRQETSVLLKNTDYERARVALDAAQQQEQASRTGVTFVSPLNSKGRFTPTTNGTSFCLTHAKPVSQPTYSVYRLSDDDDVPPKLISGVAHDPNRSTTSLSCFTYTAGTLSAGKHQLVVTTPGEMIPVTQSLGFVVSQ